MIFLKVLFLGNGRCVRICVYLCRAQRSTIDAILQNCSALFFVKRSHIGSYFSSIRLEWLGVELQGSVCLRLPSADIECACPCCSFYLGAGDQTCPYVYKTSNLPMESSTQHWRAIFWTLFWCFEIKYNYCKFSVCLHACVMWVYQLRGACVKVRGQPWLIAFSFHLVWNNFSFLFCLVLFCFAFLWCMPGCWPTNVFRSFGFHLPSFYRYTDITDNVYQSTDNTLLCPSFCDFLWSKLGSPTCMVRVLTSKQSLPFLIVFTNEFKWKDYIVMSIL